MTQAKRIPTALIALLIFFMASFAPFALAEDTADTTNALIDSLALEARGAVLIDADTGRVLYEKDAHKRTHPASTTKIMTLILALEYGHLDEEITVPAAAAQIPEGSSVVPIAPGDKMLFRDLLYGLMLKSGNDAANAIAVIVSGSVEAFVEKMNARAAEIGCADTNFMNTHGYHEANHYSTAYDLALMAREGMKDERFREIVKTLTYTMQKTDTNGKLSIKTSSLLLVPSSDFYYEPAVGIKTGTTSKAGYCFVGAAQYDEKLLISTVLYSTEGGRWTDTQTLFEKGSALYKQYSFDELYQLNAASIPVKNGNPEDSSTVRLLPATDGLSIDRFSGLPDEIQSLSQTLQGNMSVQVPESVRAPIEQGAEIGTILYTKKDGQTLSIPLVAEQSIREAPASRVWIFFVAAALLILALGSFVLLPRMRTNQRRRTQAARRRRR